jgi:[acyl-carrier-protein] S-malonyltransferase
MSEDMGDLLSRAEAAVSFDPDELFRHSDGDFTDELHSQYAAYIISCSISNILKRNSVHTDYVAGYSMGLYAALYHAESVNFEQGLGLITSAYTIIRQAAAGIDFGTGVIAGFDRDDVRSLITEEGDLEIINANNRHSFLIAGSSAAVKNALARAKNQGALNAKYLAFKLPYHSRYMNEAARDFYDYCSGLTIYDPACRLVSTIDRREISDWTEVLKDLADNINCNINWHETMDSMIASGTDTFIECGPGKSLYRIAQFIDGSFTVYHLHTMRELLSSAGVCGRVNAMK